MRGDDDNAPRPAAAMTIASLGRSGKIVLSGYAMEAVPGSLSHETPPGTVRFRKAAS